MSIVVVGVFNERVFEQHVGSWPVCGISMKAASQEVFPVIGQ